MTDPFHTSAEAVGTRRTRLALLLFAPMFVFGAVRFGLRWQVERSGVNLLPPLQSATDPDALLHGLMTGAAVLLLMLVVAWGLWRWAKNQPTRRRGLLIGGVVVWSVVWLLGAAQAGHAHINRTQVGAEHHVTLAVMGAQTVAVSTRSLGGLRMYVDWPEQGGLHTLLIESPTEDLLHRPAALTLTIVPGRWHGWFVRAWRVDAVMGDAERRVP